MSVVCEYESADMASHVPTNTEMTTTSTRLDELTYVRHDESLVNHTTMKVGGAARWLAMPNNEDELVAVLEAAWRDGVRVQNLGGGSNMVASDAGFDGVVLKLGNGFATQRVDNDLLIAGGAAYLPKLTHFAVKNKLGNFEWACGIPGHVGGSVWGNAGARGFNGHGFESRDAQADLVSVTVFDRSGARRVLERRDLEFAYRKSSLGDLIVTEAVFKLKPLSETEAKRHTEAVAELLQIRRKTQPVNVPSAGCAWKNPQVDGCAGAGQLIEQMGLKGHQVGGAQISPVHANFVTNVHGASGDDVRGLLKDVEDRVLEARGIRLEREVRLLD